MRSLARLALGVVLLSACAAEPLRAPHGKPSAPVSLRVEHLDLGGQRYEIRLSATPSVDVSELELSLLLPVGVKSESGDQPIVFGATAAGSSRSLVRRVHLNVAGADVIADARVRAAGHSRNSPRVLHIGAARAALAGPQVTRIVLPDGDVVDEVRQ